MRFGDPRLPARFWKKVSQGDDGCWVWTAANNGVGYGVFSVVCGSKRTMKLAHRLSYSALVGEIPSGLDIDHLCRNRACCNPAHLDPVTRSVNLLRGDGPRLTRARETSKEICKNGHRYDATWKRRPDGTRRCMVCARASWTKSNAKRRAERCG